MRAAVLLTLAVLLSACTPMRTEQNAPVVACSPVAWQSLIGTQAAAATFPEGLAHRIYRRGDMVTADHSDDRLNIVTDAAGRIVEVSCG